MEIKSNWKSVSVIITAGILDRGLGADFLYLLRIIFVKFGAVIPECSLIKSFRGRLNPGSTELKIVLGSGFHRMTIDNIIH